jgi:hypothetical protein
MTMTTAQTDRRYGDSPMERPRPALATGFKRLALPAVAAAVQPLAASRARGPQDQRARAALRFEGDAR